MSTEDKPSMRYSDAGVNIDAADEVMSRVKEPIKRTFNPNVLQDIGSFGAMYQLDTGSMEEPVLVSSVDGVGTKLKIAFATGIHDTVGVDLVSHCVNDILVQGAKPLFFLDYIACGTLDPDVISDVITGLAAGCRYAGCALIGGETAEMPGMYEGGEYDIAGTIVGVVDRKNIVDGSTIEDGDVVIGLESSGLHTNGYSLARKLCFEIAGLTVNDPMPGVGKTVGEALLEPHRSYAKIMQVVTRIVKVKGMAHITGGGITDNLPRTLPDGLGAEIDLSTWKLPPIFSFLKKTGNVEIAEMLRAFNCGIGFTVVVAREDEEKALDAFRQMMETPRVLGRVTKGENEVAYKGTLEDA